MDSNQRPAHYESAALPTSGADKKWMKDDLRLKEYKEILDFEMPSGELQYHTVYPLPGGCPHPTFPEINIILD